MSDLYELLWGAAAVLVEIHHGEEGVGRVLQLGLDLL